MGYTGGDSITPTCLAQNDQFLVNSEAPCSAGSLQEYSCAHMTTRHVTMGHSWCKHGQGHPSLLFIDGSWFCFVLFCFGFISVLSVFKFTVHTASSRKALSCI